MESIKSAELSREGEDNFVAIKVREWNLIKKQILFLTQKTLPKDF